MTPARGRRIPAIRNQIARVLLASAFLLSLLFGGAIFLYEAWRAVERFEAMAVAAATDLTARLAERSQSRSFILDDATIANFLAERYQVPGGHFVSVRITNDTGQILASATAHRFSTLSEHHPDATNGHVPPYKEFLVQNGELFIIVARTITGVGETFSGNFFGVFHIEAETRDHVLGAALEAVVLTALTVLLAMGVLYPIITRLHRDLILRSDELRRSHIAMLQALGSAIAKRDSDTHAHNFRVTFYAVRLAEMIERPSDEIASLIKGAFLHDLGKIAISDAILLKPGRLTDEEMSIMKTHVTHGLEMVENVPWLDDALDVVGSHHERWDGTGYPLGLSGRAIPVNARLFAIADVFDALTSRRPYKEPLSVDQALTVMRVGHGTHFDPIFLDHFLPLAAGLFAVAIDEERIAATMFHLVDTYLER